MRQTLLIGAAGVAMSCGLALVGGTRASPKPGISSGLSDAGNSFVAREMFASPLDTITRAAGAVVNRFGATLNLPGVTQVAFSGAHGCALKGDETVECWGAHYPSQHGEASPPPGLRAVKQIVVGKGYSCALLKAGTVTCWGTITPPAGLTSVQQIVGGAYSACALKQDTSVVCWPDLSVPLGLSGVMAVATGVWSFSNHACALKTDGTVLCWTGSGNYNKGFEVPPSGLAGVIRISASYLHTCALKGDGTVTCWGANDISPRPPAGLSGVTAISTGQNHTCALTQAGSVACCGGFTPAIMTPPVGLSEVIAISAGASHNCAVTVNHAAVCWGNNDSGQSTVPPGLQARAVVIGGGIYSTCATKIDGTVSCWGLNNTGQTEVPYDLTTVQTPPTVSLGTPVARAPGVHAGEAFTISGRVNTSVGSLRVACTVRVGTRAVRSTSRYTAGTATCAGLVPKGTAGKRLTGTITATIDGDKETRAFSFLIRL